MWYVRCSERSAVPLHPLGCSHLLYHQHPEAFNDLKTGANDATACFSGSGFRASEGWDPATGLGTPNFSALLVAAIQAGGGSGNAVVEA